ncbi:MAG: hypothetical protein AAF597_10955, partial [Bacteroidota bacterium]
MIAAEIRKSKMRTPICANVLRGGPAGPQGATGATGARGPAGPQGATGATGARGPAGPQGPQGLPGANGEDGTDGQDGAPGAPGAPGVDGQNGADGEDGTSVNIVGTVDDQGDLPSNPSPGDLVIIDETGEGFFFNGDNWVNIGQFRGPQGQQGQQGEQGEPGAGKDLVNGTGISIVDVNATTCRITNTGDTNRFDDVNTFDQFGGDVSGTYDDINVDRIQGRQVSSSSPSDGDALVYNNGRWEPKPVESGGGIPIIDYAVLDPENINGTTSKNNLLKFSREGNKVAVNFFDGTPITIEDNAVIVNQTAGAPGFVITEYDNGQVTICYYRADGAPANPFPSTFQITGDGL